MRVTVCELPHQSRALSASWAALCEHTGHEGSELVLLPEFAFVAPVWEAREFDPGRWSDIVVESDHWTERFPELGVKFVVGSRPATVDGRPLNQGFLWSRNGGLRPLRAKYYMPDEPGGWEARWFAPGDRDFPVFQAGVLAFGLNICTELWALETYAGYAEQGVELIFSPRATEAATTDKWLAMGVVAAARSGAFSVSSNRAGPTDGYGGVGWIISPTGRILARTSAEAPFATVEIDTAVSAAARAAHPCNVFNPRDRGA